MDKKDLLIQKLKNIVYNQKMYLYRYSIPQGNCPWQYGYVTVDEGNEIDCGTIKCSECREEFWELLGIQTKNEVEELD